MDRRKLWSSLWLFSSASFIFSCSPPWNQPARLKEWPTNKQIVVVTTTGPHSVYEEEGGDLMGLHHNLMEHLGRTVGLRIRWDIVSSEEEAWRRLKDGRAHMTTLPSLLEGHPYASTRPLDLGVQSGFMVVCPVSKELQSPSDLENLPLVVAQGSLEHLFINLWLRDNPEASLKLEAIPKSSTETLVEVTQGKDQCTLSERDALTVHQKFLPELRSVYRFPKQFKMFWHVSDVLPDLHDELATALNEVLERGDFASIRRRHRQAIKLFDLFEARVFIQRLHTRLPAYKDIYVKAADMSGFPWQLLAALSYQESHWDADATSFTGVGGLMMLTQATAREMGILDRRDPHQAIPAGALYLKKLYDRLPPHIPDSDRTKMALASYNVGYGHLQDARMLAVIHGKDPNRWDDLKEILPLLSSPHHTQHLRYGVARGREPVEFVKKIEFYVGLLDSRHPQDEFSASETLAMHFKSRQNN